MRRSGRNGRNAGMQCVDCGEPWTSRAGTHQPDCKARPLLSRGTPEGRAEAEKRYRVSFAAMEREHG